MPRIPTPENCHAKMRIVFAITGASGIELAKGVLKNIRETPGLEIHLILSQNAQATIAAEGQNTEELRALGHFIHEPGNMGAQPASGSWLHNGMIICPCSMASLAAIACGFGSNLVHRSADVALKERRPLILVTRESPLSLIHLRNMLAVTEAGATIMPFSPAFYTGDNSLTSGCRQFAGRILDLLRIHSTLCARWNGL